MCIRDSVKESEWNAILKLNFNKSNERKENLINFLQNSFHFNLGNLITLHDGMLSWNKRDTAHCIFGGVYTKMYLLLFLAKRQRRWTFLLSNYLIDSNYNVSVSTFIVSSIV